MNSPVPGTRQPNRRRLQFSLRSLLLFVLVFSIAFSWFGARLRKAERQRAAVEEFEKAGGWVKYDFEPSGTAFVYDMDRPVPPYPAWLVKRLGIDFFSDVTEAIDRPVSVPSMNGPSAPDPPGPDLDILLRFPKLHTLNVLVQDKADLAKIGKLTQIEHLNIVAPSWGDEGDEGLVHFRALNRLRTITLINWTFGPGLEHLAALPQLRELTIGGGQFPWMESAPAPGDVLPDDENQQTRKEVTSLPALEQIESLSFDGTPLSDIALAWIASCSNVRKIACTRCYLNNEDAMGAIASLRHLEELELTYSRLDAPAVEKFRAMSSLRRLAITRARIDETALQYLQGLDQLESLDLTGSPISGESLEYLAGLPRLTSLTLDFDPLTDAGAAALCRLHQVTNLKLNVEEFSANNVAKSSRSVAAIRRAFPNCRDLDNWQPRAEAQPVPFLPEPITGTQADNPEGKVEKTGK
jgi:hypothetical protein